MVIPGSQNTKFRERGRKVSNTLEQKEGRVDNKILVKVMKNRKIRLQITEGFTKAKVLYKKTLELHKNESKNCMNSTLVCDK